MENLKTIYLGLNLRNPLIAGSCGLTNSVENIKELAKKGVGAVVIKSLFEEQIQYEAEKVIKNNTNELSTTNRPSQTIFNRRIYDYDEAYSYIYDFAKRNTLGKYLYFINEAKESVDIPVIASINCVSNQDWHSFAKKIEETGVDALELNIYILPSDMRRSGEDNEKIYFDIINEVRNYVNIPVSVKIGYYFSSLSKSIKKLSQTGIKGLVLFNRPYNTDIDIDEIALSHGPIYSTSEEYTHTLRWVSIMAGQVDCDLSASTGVHDHKAFIKQLLAGATTVQIASALYKEGFNAIPEILKGTSDWMKNHNFDSVDSFRGKLSKTNLENPAAIERVQFMKLYSGIE
ncbi:MAG TPA: dihydroorotate dehydrogenase-like protein [Bacteroidales bacterium]|nr:dihydroorotate dehydrogenase-like protein [Bacteroidales bacterium]